MKKAFTLVELLTVIAVIAILMAAFTTSVEKARRRAKIARATQEIKEMTNAILAYEQYAVDRTLKNDANGSWAKCSEGAMAMILGGRSGASGEKIPVLYNAHITQGMILDPWGHPYQYCIKAVTKTAIEENQQRKDFVEAFKLKPMAVLPNENRLTPEERRVLK